MTQPKTLVLSEDMKTCTDPIANGDTLLIGVKVGDTAPMHGPLIEVMVTVGTRAEPMRLIIPRTEVLAVIQRKPQKDDTVRWNRAQIRPRNHIGKVKATAGGMAWVEWTDGVSAGVHEVVVLDQIERVA